MQHVQYNHPHSNSRFAQRAFTLRPERKCRTPSQFLIFVFGLSSTDPSIRPRGDGDEGGKPQNSEEHINDSKRIGVSKTPCPLEDWYRGLVYQRRNAQPALVFISV